MNKKNSLLTYLIAIEYVDGKTICNKRVVYYILNLNHK